MLSNERPLGATRQNEERDVPGSQVMLVANAAVSRRNQSAIWLRLANVWLTNLRSRLRR